jgi:rhodanese-related sulfurtransferase
MAIGEVDVEFLATLVERDGGTGRVRIVDVRELDEYVNGHVPGAILAPLSSLPEHVELFVADEVTYVICQAGGRSMRACEFLANQGKNVVNVAGGTGAWVAAGFDVVMGDQTR